LNFTIPSDWIDGWYYLDSDLHTSGGGGAYTVWRTPITVGQEPVTGDTLQFYADFNLTKETDMFGHNQTVYVKWNIGAGYNANNSTSVVNFKTFHYNNQSGVGWQGVISSRINWTNRTGPFIFNFSMIGLTQGGGWYWFEPIIKLNASDNIPSGNPVFGRMFLYQNNTRPNITNASTNSPPGFPLSTGQSIVWNATLTDDNDPVDRHALHICSTNSISLGLACNTYLTNSTCTAGVCNWGNNVSYMRINFTVNGTWTVPESVNSIQVEVIGAGGAGGGRGGSNGQSGGGGGGAFVRSTINVTPGSVYNISVGAGGSGGTGNGPAGGSSNFTNSSDVLVVAAGGGGGQSTTTGGSSGNSR
jgi:hypothetical protein